MDHVFRRTHWSLCIAALLALVAPAARAQSLTSGAIEGTVQDARGAPVDEASLLLSSTAGGSSRTLPVSRDGRFSAEFLPSGSYDLLVERLGFLPKLIRGVPIRPGQRVALEVVLAPAPPSVDKVDSTTFDAGVLRASRAGLSQWFSQAEVNGIPQERGNLTELARISSLAGAGLDVEGLPARMSGVVIDGVPFTPVRRPGLAVDPAGAVVFPLQMIEQAELLTNGVDVEWNGFSGGYLSAHTRRGTRDFRINGSGTWAVGSLAATDQFGPAAAGHTAQQGSLILSGPFSRDTSGFVVGVEARRFETPVQRALASASAVTELITLAQDSYGVRLEGLEQPGLVSTEVLSGFGRFDWQLASAHGLSVRGNFAALRAPQDGLGVWIGRFGGGSEGTDLSGSALLASEFSRTLRQEARIGIERSRREGNAATVAGQPASLPGTLLVAEGLELGSDATVRDLVGRTTLHLSETLQWSKAAHRIKFGAAAAFSSYEGSWIPESGGEFLFAGLNEFARGRGYFSQVVGTRPTASFMIPRYSAYVQDTWTAVPGLDLLLGVRFDLDQLPTGEITPNQEWKTLSGLSNAELEKSVTRFSPRLGFTWDPGQDHRWIVRGAAGLYSDLVDPAVIGEVVTNSGRLRVRRGLGVLNEWPGFPNSAEVADRGAALTLAAPGYAPPRTARGSLGISRLLGEHTTLHLSGTYRRTDFLPRRADLNLVANSVGTDSRERPLYGTLTKQGSLLVAEPGSNRRFPALDRVYAINTDGWSEYMGGTVALEHRPIRMVTAFGSYTYSTTQDNWFGARSIQPDAQLSPFPQRLSGTDWTEGRSDFDVPHRAVFGGELRFGGRLAPRVAALYRYHSGYPFTPGFRTGVDANGDGSARNDPAFVDNQVTGMQELVARWSCLQGQIGRVTERNACREPAVHALDARVALDLALPGQHSAAFIIDGFNLLSSDAGETDRALYLVDASRSLQRDAAGRVMLPLVANPNFGNPLARYATGRTIRIGFQLSY